MLKKVWVVKKVFVILCRDCDVLDIMILLLLFHRNKTRVVKVMMVCCGDRRRRELQSLCFMFAEYCGAYVCHFDLAAW